MPKVFVFMNAFGVFRNMPISAHFGKKIILFHESENCFMIQNKPIFTEQPRLNTAVTVCLPCFLLANCNEFAVFRVRIRIVNGFLPRIITAARNRKELAHFFHSVLVFKTVYNSVFYCSFHFLSSSSRKFRSNSFSISRRRTFASNSSGLFVGRPFLRGKACRRFTSGRRPHHDSAE